MTTKTKPKVPGTYTGPSSRDELQKKRHGTLAKGPSGFVYKVRRPNLERHALSGGLPAKLRAIALGGTDAVNALFATPETDDPDVGTEEAPAAAGMTEEGHAVRGYLDEIVLKTVVEPKLTLEDLGTGQLDDDPLLPTVDYKWLVDLAFGNMDYDGEGRRVFGIEPLTRWATFRDFHECAPDCASCGLLAAAFSAPIG